MPNNTYGPTPPPPPPPPAGSPTIGVPLPPALGFIDPLEALQDAHELIVDGWKEFLSGKGAKLRSELLGRAVIGAATGSSLPFPLGFAAGAVGVEVIPPGSITYAEYVALSLALRNAMIRGRTITGVLPGFGGKLIRFATGPTGLAVTGGSVLFFRIAGPPKGEGSIVVEVIRGLTTFGIDDTGLEGGQGNEYPAGLFGWGDELPDADLVPLTDNLLLVAFWTKDP